MKHGLLLSLILVVPARADEPMAVNPNRPTFATPALTSAPGQLELEVGGQDSLGRDHSASLGTPILLKWGLGTDLELRASSPGLLRLAPPDGPATRGPGDLNLGVQWCFRHDGLLGMDHGLQVNHTFPTASASRGLGSGAASNGVVFLSSRDLGSRHLDVNLLETWVGRPAAQGGGRVRQPAATVSLSQSLSDAWSVTGEVYTIGGTRLGSRVVSNLWALGYKVSPGLVLDAAVDLGLTQGAPRMTVQAGLTVALARFHPWI